MCRLAEANWDWSRKSIRTVYQATQRSVAEYAAPAWEPWISGTSRENLERAQLKAARHITAREHRHNTNPACAQGGGTRQCGGEARYGECCPVR